MILERWPQLGKLDVESTGMGQPGIDVKLSTAARELFPFGSECKNQEAFSIWAAMKQARVNAENQGLLPLVIYTRNREEIWAALRFEDLLRGWKNEE